MIETWIVVDKAYACVVICWMVYVVIACLKIAFSKEVSKMGIYLGQPPRSVYMGKTLPPRLVPPPPPQNVLNRLRPAPVSEVRPIRTVYLGDGIEVTTSDDLEVHQERYARVFSIPAVYDPVVLDLSIEEHRRLWAEFEAVREFDDGACYSPVPIEELVVVGGKINRIAADPR